MAYNYTALPSPVINYITNSTADNDTVGWATYADAAQTTPVDGTGGSPQASLWIRSTTSPLRKNASFRLDKTGSASRQGQGVSFDFTIDKADTAKVLTVSFDYEVAAGTYANGDVTVYIYDVTNATVIQPAGYIVQNVASGTENKHIATFQTHATSTSYRLILHIASTSAQNYTLAIDNVVVGPQTVQYGAPITDWVSFTPTINWSATSSTNLGKWRRVGDSVEIETRLVLNGAPTGNFTFTLPFGWSIDSTKANSLSGGYCGVANIDDYGSGAHQMNILIIGSTQVQPYGDDGGGGLSPTVPFTLGNTDIVSLLVRVPIQGWSSTVQMSSDTDTRVVAFRGSSVGTTIATGSADTAVVVVPGLALDTHGAYNASTGAYTVPVPGNYKITHQNLMAIGSAKQFRVGYTINSTSAFNRCALKQIVGATGEDVCLTCSDTVYCDAGTVIRFAVAHNNTANTALINDGRFQTFTIERVSGPSAIAASEKVYAIYTDTSGQSLTADVTNVEFKTKQFDSHGCWNGTTFTAPRAGLYYLTGLINGTATNVNVELFVNGSLKLKSDISSSSITVSRQMYSFLWYFNGGDTGNIRVDLATNTSSNTVLHWIGIASWG